MRVWTPLPSGSPDAGVAVRDETVAPGPLALFARVATFISNALARGFTVFETARIAGTSVAMIDAHYGALLDTAHDSLLEHLDVTGEVAR